MTASRQDRLARMLRARRSNLALELERQLGEQVAADVLTAQDEKIEIGDRSAGVHDQDVELAIVDLKRRQLRQIDGALGRLEGGDYGVCEECGAEIGEDRLEILPFAAYCVDCQRRIEAEAQRAETTGRGFRAEFGDLREGSREDEEES
jgi:DnaK suppressor protein